MITSANTPSIDLTDAQLAPVLVTEKLAGDWVWTTGLGWLRWTGKIWRPVSDEQAREQVRQWIISRYDEAMRCSSEAFAAGDTSLADQWLKEAKAWLRFQHVQRLEATLKLARGLCEHDAGEFDQQKDLLNCSNGVVDLRTGELLEHDPKFMFTKITRARYVPGARHQDWDAALEAVPEEIREYYQVRMGQAITGHQPQDDVVLIQQGAGSNGKTTIHSAMVAALGMASSNNPGYLLVAPKNILYAAGHATGAGHSEDLANLAGVRIMVLEETSEDKALDTVALKLLAGTTHITASRKYGHLFTFETSHTFLVNTNYKPKIIDTDHGTWRRVQLLVFPYTFVAGSGKLGPGQKPGDANLRNRLKQGSGGRAEAVLAWLVAGAVAWYKAGLEFPEVPERIVAETEEWRGSCDLLHRYLTERCEFDSTRHVMSTDLFEEFNNWLEENGHRKISSQTFAGRLEDHELAKHRGIYRQVVRKGAGKLSKSGYRDAPKQYTAWWGLAFQSD